jgi:ectoine hydroxylase-related dioxygenase (phytanoyl-CoA dioxygenase family)
VSDLARDGFSIAEHVLDEAAIHDLKSLVEGEVKRDAGRGGVRNLLDIPEMKELARRPEVRGLVEPILGPHAKVVRGILFDKTSDANWKVPWHQDCTIPVAEKVDVEGYGPWSVKAGVVHVQPPVSVLERMLSVRIHLDDCPLENGALRVIAGSHRAGKIPEARIADVVSDGQTVVCEVSAGGVLVMRPLLVHSSSAAVRAGHRRVLHFDFAMGELGQGLQWALDADER